MLMWIRLNVYLASCLLLFWTLPTTHAANAANFATCTNELRDRAVADGIRPVTIDRVFTGLEHLERVVRDDRNQAEFTQTFNDYYSRRVNERRVTTGRERLATHAPLLAAVSAETGVPSQYLMALWGLETNFGGYMGTLSIPSALATLACDTRRASFFKSEFSAMLRIVDAGDMDVDDLVGSWAGAMGHMQFMPSTFLAHAVDGDGDGKRNVYSSLADAFTSGATYLSRSGWQPGFRWGREVRLPEGFDYTEAGLKQKHPLSFWRSRGVTDIFGSPLPNIELEASVLVPAGHRGPAFVVYQNFRVLMRWNRSEFYALSVARLADRIAGAGRLAVAPPKAKLAIADVKFAQAKLASLGLSPGPADGVLGSGTKTALSQFQAGRGMVADGYPDAATLSALRASDPASANDR